MRLGRVAAGPGVGPMEAFDGLLEALAADEPHGVVRPAVLAGAQAVDRDDARMLQPAGDLGLPQEPSPADGVVGVVGLDLLEGDLAVQLRVQRHEDRADPAPGMMPDELEPAPVRRRLAQGEAGVAGIVGAERGTDADRQGAHIRRIGIADRPESYGGRVLPAALGLAAALLEVTPDEAVEHRPIIRAQGAAIHQDLAHRPRPLLRPALEAGDQIGLLDQAVLKREDAEEQVAFGFDFGDHGQAPWWARTGRRRVEGRSAVLGLRLPGAGSDPLLI